MNELSSLGLILLFALLVGHLVKFLRIPEVTGYILAGVVTGPSGLGWITRENLSAIQVFSEVALGLILFSIGSFFELDRFLKTGMALVRITLSESVAAGLAVMLAMLVLGPSWQVALILGSIAMATAPASTLMVIRERNASGPLTETLTGVIGLNNIFCLVAFTLVTAVVELAQASGVGILPALYRSIYPLVWQIAGSVALGYLVGLLLAAWVTRVLEEGELLILLSGCVLLCVGVAIALELSVLVASLAVGATLVNFSAHTRRVMRALASSGPPFYAIFFVIAGAGLNLSLVKSLGLLGLVYVGARVAGKVAGARWATARAGMSPTVQRYLGFALLAQADLAIGLSLVVNRRFPDLAPEVITVVLAAVSICDVLGPIAARFSIDRAGEARPSPTTLDVTV